MIKTIIRLALVLVIGLLGYNFFLGTPAEKAQSREVINKVKEGGKTVFQAVGGLLKSEKDKLDDGKYDEALGGVRNAFSSIKKEAKSQGGKFRDEIAELDKEQDALQEEVAKSKDQNPEEKKRTGERIGKLIDRITALSEKMEGN